jgi:hypothetical protein
MGDPLRHTVADRHDRGVIGGYQQGGDTPSISYSAYLNSDIHQLYEQAISDGTAT